MKTIALNESGDLALNSQGNMFVLTDGLAIAQDVSRAIRLFLGELWYDTTQGIPYFSQILGQEYSKALVEGILSDAAKSVPGVVSVRATIIKFDGRTITGEVRFIDTEGRAHNVHF